MERSLVERRRVDGRAVDGPQLEQRRLGRHDVGIPDVVGRSVERPVVVWRGLVGAFLVGRDLGRPLRL